MRLASLVAASAGLAGSVGAATASAAVTVSPANTPYVGVTLTATADAGYSISGWYDCSASGTAGGKIGSGSSYTLAIGDIGQYVCAEEQPDLLGLTSYSAPVGPVALQTGPSLPAAGQAVQQGQTLTVTQGDWGSGATVSDVWEDCSSSGSGCTAITPRATGTSYTVARADAGHTIAVVETASQGGASATRTTAPTGLATASAPDDSTPPTVTGDPVVGSTLTASPGSWSNQPTGYAYAWARCSAGGCARIPGADRSTYVPVTADVGSSLEVFVTASVGSSSGVAYPSYPTATVTTAGGSGGSGSSGSGGSGGTSGTGGAPGHRLRTLGHITATMMWSFHYAPSFTQVLGLDVEAPALGSVVTTTCRGHGCPYRTHRVAVSKPRGCGQSHRRRCRAPKTLDLQTGFRSRRLAAGDRITISITRSREVGKYYRFVTRRAKQPTVHIACLAPGSHRPGRGCRL